MDDSTMVALLAAAVIILFVVLSSNGEGRRRHRHHGQRVPYVIEDDTVSPTGFISPSGGASADFLPVEDGDPMRYSEFS
jgi:hypothetical protein